MEREITGIKFLRDKGGALDWRDHPTAVGLFEPEGLVVVSPLIIAPLEQLGGFHLTVKDNLTRLTRAVARIRNEPDQDILLGVLYGSTPMGDCLRKWIEMANELCPPMQ